MVVQMQGVRVVCSSRSQIGHHSGQIERRVLHVYTCTSSAPFVCTHYQMLSWPDHGAPEETQPIQDLMCDIDQVRVPTSVHCNASSHDCDLLIFTLDA